MEYSELSEQEQRIWDQIYSYTYHVTRDAYDSIREADRAIYDLRREQKRK